MSVSNQCLHSAIAETKHNKPKRLERENLEAYFSWFRACSWLLFRTWAAFTWLLFRIWFRVRFPPLWWSFSMPFMMALASTIYHAKYIFATDAWIYVSKVFSLFFTLSCPLVLFLVLMFTSAATSRRVWTIGIPSQCWAFDSIAWI